MKLALILAAIAAMGLTACSTTPLPGPDIAPICKDNNVPGLQGCYGQKG